LVPVSASAQSVAVFGGYQWAHPDFESVHLLGSDLNGWRAAAVVNVLSHFEIVAQSDGLYGKTFNTGIVIRPLSTARPWFYSLEAGPRYNFQPKARVSPYVEGLIGVTHGQVATMVSTSSARPPIRGSRTALAVGSSFIWRADSSYRPMPPTGAANCSING